MFHLGMLSFPIQTHNSIGTWKSKEYPFNSAFDRPELWIDVAKACEDARFDFLFAADSEGIFAEYKNSRDGTLKGGKFVPAFDQTVIADYILAHTRHLGVVATVSTTASQPYLTARRFASMDHLSRGRVAWNIVTSTHRAGVLGVGLTELPSHDDRYAQADEYVALCKELWQGWDEGAVIVDKQNDVFIDPAKVHDIHFEGRFYRSYAPLNLHRSPQGGPVLAQAGASKVGVAFAARHAELMFAIQPYRKGMKEYYDRVKSAVSDAGRDPNTVKVMFAMNAFVGESEAEAREKYERHRGMISPEGAMVTMSGLLGVDLSKVDPTAPIAELDVPGAQGHIQAWAQSGHNTVFDATIGHAAGAGPAFIGTPAQIVEQMRDTMEFVGGDGFVYHPLYLPYDLLDFTQQVVPLLQKSGLTRRDYSGGTLRENLGSF
jgi:FMN-dependent oxidoreductase (nitrilotriacetate monooxygenase family)